MRRPGAVRNNGRALGRESVCRQKGWLWWLWGWYPPRLGCEQGRAASSLVRWKTVSGLELPLLSWRSCAFTKSEEKGWVVKSLGGQVASSPAS